MVNGARNGRAKGALMNSLSWRLAKLISLMLEKDEREAVCGDLLESGESGLRALGGMLGLVMRRQAVLLTDRRSLIVLILFVIPSGLLLGLIARIFASSGAVYLWLYFNNWNWRYLESPGARALLVVSLGMVLIQYLTLACWAYTTGYVLRLMGRRANQMHAFFFCVLLLLEKFARLPALIGLKLYPAVSFRATAAVFAVPFYRVMLPVIIQMVMVAAPAIWGMHHATRVSTLGPRLRMLLRLAAGATVCVMGLQICWWVAVFPPMAAAEYPWPFQILRLVVYWPILYWIARIFIQRRPAASIAN